MSADHSPTNSFELHLAIAEGLVDLGEFEEAWSETETMIAVFASDHALLSLRLDILVGQKRWREAVELGKKCLRKWPVRGNFLLRTANAMMAARAFMDAYTLLNKAPKSVRRMADYYFALAQCTACMGRMAETRAALKMCFALDDENRLKDKSGGRR